jgi:hypothetical protein
MNKPVTEAELIARNQFPRVTFDQLQANIVGKKFVQHDLLTICILTLASGFTVVGKSACAVPGNFKLDVGQRLAEHDAIGQVWPLMGYELKSKVALAMSATGPSNPEQKTYVGTKVIHAQPMSKTEYNYFRGRDMPKNEDPNEDGYLVEYPDQNSNTPLYQGYVSWSPKEVFEKSYDLMDIRGEGCIGGLTWRDRLVIEKDELLERLDKLTTFLAGPLFLTLPEEQQVLMNKQKATMSSYLTILNLRLVWV